MASALKTSVTELPESRVRVEAEVPAEEVERRVAQAASALGREMRIPGFRKGKVPPPVVIGRFGREAVLDEAVRKALTSWYLEAVDAAGIIPVGEPELDIGDLPGEGEPLTFSIEIGVQPIAALGEYKGIEVGRREPEVADQAVEQELEGLRERLAKLETADRPAEAGDFVVMDYVGSIDGTPFEGGAGRDQLVELGSERLVPGFEEQLIGARAGDERTVEVTFPADYGAEQLAGRPASFAVTVKEVKLKELPDVDDDFAADAAGFDTLEELRDDIASKLAERERAMIDNEFREAVLDSVVAGSRIEVPEALVEARAHELFDQMVASLRRRGLDKQTYLKIAGRTEEELIVEAKPEAAQAIRRDAVLAAVVEAEGIQVSEEELLSALEHSAEHEQTTPTKLLARLRERGGEDSLRRDLAMRKAVDFLAEHAQAIPVEQAQAREKLWTPEKGSETPAAGGLWTPGG